MIEKVREACQRDDRLVSALMYGSFSRDEGDEFSDVEFYLFFRDEMLEEVNEAAWVSQIAPVALYYVNEFGNGTAVFENLIRGEFHFEGASDREALDTLEFLRFPSLGSAVLADKDGELYRRATTLAGPPSDPDTPEQALFLCNGLVNWSLMGVNLLGRGEHARAEAFLTLVHGHLLQAARLVEGTTANWLSPSRRLEEDLSFDAYERFRSCTAQLDGARLVRAYQATWEWGRELMASLSGRHALELPEALLVAMDRRVSGVGP